MARRYIGTEEVRIAKRTKHGTIRVKLQHPHTRVMRWEVFTPDDYEKKVRRDAPSE